MVARFPNASPMRMILSLRRHRWAIEAQLALHRAAVRPWARC